MILVFDDGASTFYKHRVKRAHKVPTRKKYWKKKREKKKRPLSRCENTPKFLSTETSNQHQHHSLHRLHRALFATKQREREEKHMNGQSCCSASSLLSHNSYNRLAIHRAHKNKTKRRRRRHQTTTPNTSAMRNDGFSPMEREELVQLENNGDLYVFGYGSIVWKFEIEGIKPIETVRCKAFGWQRRFYQGSTDHRGTLEFPGRTVTMTKCSKDSPVYGVAYRIKKEDVEKCMENLEFREKQYDLRVQLEIYEDDDDDTGDHATTTKKKMISSKAVCWIATEDKKNVNWVGEQTIDEIATVIAKAKGPSGPNYEYLFNLADAMRSFNIEDEHLYELEAKVKKLLGDNTKSRQLK